MNDRSAVQHRKDPRDVDGVLRDFFQSEMPRTWPAFKAPFQARQLASFWSRASSRLALAACVALLVGGYLALSGIFPTQQISTGVESVGGMIGQKEKANRPERPIPHK